MPEALLVRVNGVGFCLEGEELGCCGAFLLLLDVGSKLDPGPLCSGQEKWEKGKDRGSWAALSPRSRLVRVQGGTLILYCFYQSFGWFSKSSLIIIMKSPGSWPHLKQLCYFDQMLLK